MASAEETPEPLKYQTWVLKVSIHCEGCTKKVKKVLNGIEGVYKTNIDSHQQKVTVTGAVEAQTLIKKLLKTGKHAELWPHPKPANPNQNGGGKNKNKNSKNKASGSPDNPVDTKESESDKGDAAKPDSKSPDGSKKGKKGNNGGGGEAGTQEQSTQKPATAMLPMPRQQAYNFPVYHVPAAGPPTYVESYDAVQPPAMGSYYVPSTTTMSAMGSHDAFSEENGDACSVM